MNYSILEKKPTLLVPTGGGGKWLSNLIYSLNSNDLRVIPSSLNFHSEIYKKTNLVRIAHYPSDDIDVSKYTVETIETHDSFCGLRSSFISLVCAYDKFWIFNDYFKSLTQIEQFFYLTDDSRWRTNNPVFNKLYLERIVLNFDFLYTNPNLFVQQLFDWLDQKNISYVADKDYVLRSINNFKSTCYLDKHFGIVESPVWQAWCHALIIDNNFCIDFSIADNFQQFLKYVDKNNQQFKDLTREKYIVEVL